MADESRARVLVTGGPGFIGRRLVRVITERATPGASNVYGPGMQEKDSLIPRLMRAAASLATVWPEFSEAAR